MIRDDISPMPEYFDRYILTIDNIHYMKALQESLAELQQLSLHPLLALGTRVYAAGKWTVNTVMQHIIDTERIFSYRALAFARCETGKVPGFDEDHYAHHSDADSRTLASIVDELIALRLSTIAMYESFSHEAMIRSGMGASGEYSVLAIAYILAGHQRWHLGVIDRLYRPLL